MEVGGIHKLIEHCSYTFKIITLFLLIIGCTSSSEIVKCPFEYIYHFGDGATDIGNSVRVLPLGPSFIAAHPPYGQTFPGKKSTGRWSNGLIHVDFIASDLGLPNIIPYLALNQSTNYDGVIFSVDCSPVLDLEFYRKIGITSFPSTVAPLSLQLNWFRQYLTLVCSNSTDCDRITRSIIFFGDIEASDIGRALVDGQSVQQIKTYVPQIVEAQVNAARELIKMGAKQIAFTESGPLGCYPYVLTNLTTSDISAYDEVGCLKSVNELIVFINSQLLQAVNNLIREYPQLTIIYADYYDIARLIIAESSVRVTSGVNPALKPCCGIGGRYNYDRNRVCGRPGVPVCSNPEKSIFWDGWHLTQQAYLRIEHLMLRPILPLIGCVTHSTKGEVMRDMCQKISHFPASANKTCLLNHMS